MMLNLMQSIWTLSPPLFINNPIHHQDHIALNQHSKLLQWLIHPYISIELNLHEQLKYLSAVMHVVYVFSMHENAQSSYIPAMLYWDIQIMIKNAYFYVVKMNCDNPEGKFFLTLLGAN